MNIPVKFLKVVLWFLIVLVLASSALTASIAADTCLVRPMRDDTMLLNPGKGFVQYYGADTTYTKDFIALGYSRVSWAKLEPEEGQFDWREIDAFINEFKAHGKKIGFGVMSISTGYGTQYVTPKWVFDAGAKPFAIPDDSSPTKTQIIAKQWDDPVFVAQLGKFIRALGQRYDGNPDIAFFDIRSYGNWGEGHVGFLGGMSLAPPDIYEKYYLQPYLAAFKKSQLIVTWGSDYYDQSYDWAVAQVVGIRRDGILSEWSKDGSECRRAYGHAPAVFEYCDSYETTKKKGYWNTNLLMKCIQAGKPSYLQWDSKIFEENQGFCQQLGNKIGYHFVLLEAAIPAKVKSGTPFAIQWQWSNDGVAPLYEPCQVAVALLDTNNQVVEKQWLPDSHPQNWKPDETNAETVRVTFSSSPAGKIKLAIGLFRNRQDTVPSYRLGILGRTDQGWYVLNETTEISSSVGAWGNCPSTARLPTMTNSEAPVMPVDARMICSSCCRCIAKAGFDFPDFRRGEDARERRILTQPLGVFCFGAEQSADLLHGTGGDFLPFGIAAHQRRSGGVAE